MGRRPILHSIGRLVCIYKCSFYPKSGSKQEKLAEYGLQELYNTQLNLFQDLDSDLRQNEDKKTGICKLAYPRYFSVQYNLHFNFALFVSYLNNVNTLLQFECLFFGYS